MNDGCASLRLSLFGLLQLSFFISPHIQIVYPFLAGLGILAGVIDILLFSQVEEPEPPPPPNDTNWWKSILEPIQDPIVTPFLIFSCWVNFSVMMAASFMGYYLLKVIGLPVWQVALLWRLQSIGVQSSHVL